MTEKIIDAIVLKSQDFKDNDKIVYLFSPAEGKLSAVLKGVKKASAKLKFAGEPFCFAEYTCVKRGDMYTITNAYQKESFFELRQDITTFYCGVSALEIVSAFAVEGDSNPQLFVSLVKTLELLVQGVSPKMVLAHFALTVLDNFGQKPCFEKCVQCGDKVSDAKFCFEDGGVLCKNCDSDYSVSLDEGVRKVLVNLCSLKHEKLSTYKIGDVLANKTLYFLNDLFAKNFKKINSLNQLLQL